MQHNQGLSHAYRKGDTVTVFNSAINGAPVIEGIATVVKQLPVSHRYLVRFDGEKETYERFVYQG